MYPAVGFTKGHVIDYYTRVAPALLPHLRDRPLTLKRYPNGVEGGHFYEKQCPSHRPDWVRSEPVELSSKTIDFCVCDDLPTLVWLANLADLELHPSLSKVPEPSSGRRIMAFDLDPGEGTGLRECCEVALLLRDALEPARARVLREDVRLEGHPGLRAAERPTTWTTTTAPSGSRRRSRGTSRRSTRS